MTARPAVLITNDDGFEADGLVPLARAVDAAGFDVAVAAPVHESSGTSAAISAVATGGHVDLRRRTLRGLARVPAWAVGGTPALISLIALRGAFGTVPAFVLSGINRGANTGRAVMHSGTVGAALTASVGGCRAMAVSLDLRYHDERSEPDRHWSTAGAVVASLMPVLCRMPSSTVLNVNVPDLPPDRLAGLREARLGGFGRVQITEVEPGSGLVRVALEDIGTDPDPASDSALLAADYATVTALRPVSEVDPALPLDLPAVPQLAPRQTSSSLWTTATGV